MSMFSLRTPIEYLEANRQAFMALLHAAADSADAGTVAIARKGPRVLEVLRKCYGEIPVDPDTVVSDKAFPFMSGDLWRDRTWALFDDVVIYGRTFSDRMRWMRNAEANVRGYCLAMNTSEINPMLAEPTCALALEPSETAVFNNMIVRSFGYLVKPYDIEHPVLNVLYEAATMGDLRRRLESITDVTESTGPLHRVIGAAVLTAEWPDPEWSTKLMSESASKSVLHDGASKVRLYLDGRGRVLRVVPMHLVTILADVLAGGQLFNSHLGGLDNLVAEARELVQANEPGPRQRLRALMRLVSFLVAYAHGVRFLQLLGPGVCEADATAPYGTLDPLDLRLLFGPHFAKRVLNCLQESNEALLDLCTVTRYRQAEFRLPEATDLPASDSVADSRLLEAVRPRLDSALAPDLPIATNMANVFKCVYLNYEVEQRRAGDEDRENLLRGFTYPELRGIIEARVGQVDGREFSQALDYLIDSGAIVPLFQDLGDAGVGRIYRFGEAVFGPDEFAYLVQLCARHLGERCAALRLSNDANVIPALVFEKAFAYLFQEAFDRRGWQLEGVEVQTQYELYGVRPYVKEGAVPPLNLPRWCRSHRIIQDRSDARPITLSADFDDLHPPDQCPLNPDDVEVARSIITVFAEAVRNNTSKHALALTTVNSHANYLASIEAELSLWFSAPERSFREFRNRAVTLRKSFEENGWPGDAGEIAKRQNDDPSFGAEADAMGHLLAACANYLAQVDIKREVWDSLGDINAQLATAVAGGQDGPAMRHLWNLHCEGRVDANQRADLVPRTRTVLHLARLCRSATSLSRTFWSENALWLPPSQGRDGGHARLTERVKEYRAAVAHIGGSQPTLNVTSVFSDRVATGATFQERYEAFLADLREVFKDLGGLYSSFVAETAPLSVVELGEHRTVVTYDWIDGSEAPDLQEKRKRTEFAASLYDALRTYCKLRLREEVTAPPITNDENSFVLKSTPNALRLAFRVVELVAEAGMSVRVGLATTRETEHFDYVESQNTMSGRAYVLAAHLRDLCKHGEEEEGVQFIMHLSDQAKDECVADPAFDESSFLQLGEHAVKGIAQKVHVWRWIA